MDSVVLERQLIPPNKVFFSWYINNECNYKCSFCSPENYKTALVKAGRWIEVWNDIYDRYGECHIHISGGEPFIYPNFMELIISLAKKHTLEFSTNLSCDMEPFVGNISPKRARLGGSFHPEDGDFDDFLKKTTLLKKSGFDVWVNYVAYPPHLKDMARYKKAVEETLPGVLFAIQPFNGKYEGRDYPQGYTEEERRLMNPNGSGEVNKETFDWRANGAKNAVKNKSCRMGQMYARIYPDGVVLRCCGNGASKLGNLLDGTFKLYDKPMPCECDNCPCWKCMLVGKEDYWSQYWIAPEKFIS